jgi:hypothetical protein
MRVDVGSAEDRQRRAHRGVEVGMDGAQLGIEVVERGAVVEVDSEQRGLDEPDQGATESNADAHTAIIARGARGGKG